MKLYQMKFNEPATFLADTRARYLGGRLPSAEPVEQRELEPGDAGREVRVGRRAWRNPGSLIPMTFSCRLGHNLNFDHISSEEQASTG